MIKLYIIILVLMDKLKSNDLNFLFLINKSTFLLEYIDVYYQKEILNDINRFIKNLNDTFSKQYFEDDEKKKEKTFEILNKYFENLINDQILYLIDVYHKHDKQDIIMNCEKKANKIILEKKKEEQKNIENKVQSKVNDTMKTIKDDFYKQINFNDQNKQFDSINNFDKIIQEKIELFFVHFEKKLKNDIDNILSNNIYENVNKQINDNNSILNKKIEDFLKFFLNEEGTYNNISKKIKSDLNKVYEYLEENKKVLKELEKIKDIILENEKKVYSIENNIFKKVNVNFEEKVKLLTNIFNQTMNNISSKLNHKIDEVEKNGNSFIQTDLLEKLEQKLNQTQNQNKHLDKNNFEIKYNKEKNEIELYYFQELLTSTKLNIKGLIGPRGPPGPPGEKGNLSIIRKINIDNDNKLKFTLQNGTQVYQLYTEESLPQGPPGIKGEKGDPGQINVNIKWNQNDVMKINKEHNESLIFLKSLCIGENSHCLKNNSLSIGGGICYKDNSISIGNNSKTFDSNSMAFCGSTLGKNSISYFSENVEENCIGIGNKLNEKYNIEKFYIKSKEIYFDCDELILNDKLLKNKYLKILEDKVNYLENEILLLKNNN